MGNKPSKSSDDRLIKTRSIKPNRKRQQENIVIPAVAVTPSTTTIITTKDVCETPTTTTTVIEAPPNNNKINVSPNKRTSPNINFDPIHNTSNAKKSRRTKHISILSSTSTQQSDFYQKSNTSSGWTTLSNDYVFSQIEQASTFTEITDHSTISIGRKSCYPVVNVEASTAAAPQTTSIGPLTSDDIIHQLESNKENAWIIIKDAYTRAQQQNDPYDWHQFYLAMAQHYPKTTIGVVYLARCLISGLGTAQDTARGLSLLKQHPSCETNSALGHCLLQQQEKIKAFVCFQSIIDTYTDLSNPYIKSTVAEVQCTMARLLFQGEGVQQDTQKAFQLLLSSAENTNMYAQFLIGVHYERGLDVPQDFEKAKHYYGKSADQGFPDAQAALGCRLIAENNLHGLEYLEKAVQMGNSRAHVQLGILYDKGELVQQDHDVALLHYKAAVENNNHAAQYILGLVYYFGRLGRQKNHKEAIRLIKQAAMAGLPYAQRVLGQFYQQGSIIQGDATRSSSTRNKKNEREAIRWYKRAATGKDVSAMGILGRCYELGQGVEIDLEKALAFYAKAAEQPSLFVCHAQIDQALLLQKMARHQEAFCLYTSVLNNPKVDLQSLATAQLSVARYHLCHDVAGVTYDPVLAHEMLTKLVEKNSDPHAHYWLGSIYDEGIPGLFEIDRQKAFAHFMLAADGGDQDATFLVAYMMSNHVIPDKGPSDAFPYYQTAATLGHRMSMYSVGLCYYKGIGTTVQLDLAMEWFEKAARLGVVESMSYMCRLHLASMVATQDAVLSQQQFVKAVHWLKRGSEADDTYCQRELGKIYLTGKGLNVDYRLAFDLLTKAAKKQDAEAITFLGDCYHKGTGVEKNLDKAIEHYLRATSLGYPFAFAAAAEFYYAMGNMELAYDFYLQASELPKLKNIKIGKTCRMMIARLSLGYIPPMKNNPALLDALFRTRQVLTVTEAFDILSQLSIEEQFPQAFQALGCCYRYGTGTAVNPVQAIFWFRKSAHELNDSMSYFDLADVCISENDFQPALSYLNQSAELGYSEAQYRLGMAYLRGEYGTAVDERAAAHWFKLAGQQLHANSIWALSQMAGMIQQSDLELQYQKKAAALGHVVAMRTIGRYYLEQLKMPFLDASLVQQQYLEEGLAFLHRAGDLGDTASLVLLGKAYNQCTKTKVKFTTHLPTPCDDNSSDDEEGESRFQCEEDEKNLAIECFERAAALGDIDATLYAAEAWHEQKQYAAALEYFEKAAAQGNVIARFFCARYCIEGYGGSPLDPKKGFEELLICANEFNCIHAFNTLGQCYENGIGTMKNDQIAYEWYVRAAEATQDAEAYYRIGRMIAEERIPSDQKEIESCKFYDLAINATPDNHGPSSFQLGLYHLDKDVCLAIEYLRTAAELNVTEAMLQLGLLFLNDDYSLEDQEEGLAHLEHAAQLGLPEAQFELGLFYHRGKEVEERHDDDDNEDHEECILIPQDFEKAYDLFCRAEAQRHPTAAYYLGIYHQHGIFVAPDLSIALEQYEVAVELFENYATSSNHHRWQAEFNLARILHQDQESRAHAYELFQTAHAHAPAQYKFLSQIMIARYHLHGWANVASQPEEAFATLLEFASEHFGVYLDVAQCYEQGLGVTQDFRQAFHWYGLIISKAHTLIPTNETSSYDIAMVMDEEIEEDEACAMFRLAEFYRKGLVVAKDEKKADDLYHLAARKGNLPAQEYLSFMLQKATLYD